MRRLIIGMIAAFVLAGCSSVPEGAVEAEALACPPGTDGCDAVLPVGPGGDLSLEAGNFFFNVVDGIAVTGPVEVEITNVSDAYHNAEFLGAADGSDIPEADAMATGTGTVLLFPGQWTVICNVPGHREAGMETTITVFATEDEAAEAEAEIPADGGASDAA